MPPQEMFVMRALVVSSSRAAGATAGWKPAAMVEAGRYDTNIAGDLPRVTSGRPRVILGQRSGRGLALARMDL